MPPASCDPPRSRCTTREKQEQSFARIAERLRPQRRSEELTGTTLAPRAVSGSVDFPESSRPRAHPSGKPRVGAHLPQDDRYASCSSSRCPIGRVLEHWYEIRHRDNSRASLRYGNSARSSTGIPGHAAEAESASQRFLRSSPCCSRPEHLGSHAFGRASSHIRWHKSSPQAAGSRVGRSLLRRKTCRLTAANFVRENERGTVERLLVSPARPMEVFLAKIVPTVVLVLILSAVSFLVVLIPAFGLPFRGSVVLFFSVPALYVFAMTSMGIAIAVVARNMAQAVMIMILILQPMVFLSGAWNPPEAMNPWLRWISLLSPLRVLLRLCLRGDPEGERPVRARVGRRGHRRAGNSPLRVFAVLVQEEFACRVRKGVARRMVQPAVWPYSLLVG